MTTIPTDAVFYKTKNGKVVFVQKRVVDGDAIVHDNCTETHFSDGMIPEEYLVREATDDEVREFTETFNKYAEKAREVSSK